MRIAPFSGGYVGVDVFFVISGYLITQFIARDAEHGRFSFAEFYERRVRRLFPALFAVFAAVALAGGWLLVPADLENLGRSLVAATLFVSNVLFFLDAGYFALPAESRPLLHTWSLAVEEQFYIFYPVFLVLLYRFAPHMLRRTIVVLALVSFTAGVVVVAHHPEAAFYLAPFRAWELLVGAALALGCVPPLRGRAARELAAGAGLLMVVFATVAYSGSTVFPGIAALLPCLGTALVIHAGTAGDGVTTRLLRTRALVALGLISYSLYLWHWPLLVFTRYFLVREPTAVETAAMLAASIVVAALSWRFVERPFRRRRSDMHPRRVLATAAPVMVAAVALGVVAQAANGFPGRLSPQTLAYATAQGRDEACFPVRRDRLRPDRLCAFGTGGRHRVLLWGDSHAAALLSALRAAADGHDVRGWLVGQSACPPLLGVTRPKRPGHACVPFNDAVLAFIERYDVDTAVLVARWSINVAGRPEAEMRGGAREVRIADEHSNRLSLAQNVAVFRRGLERTLTALERLGVRVWVVEQVPYVGLDVPAALARLAATERSVDAIAPTRDAHREHQALARKVFDELGGRYVFERIDPAATLCPSDHCLVAHQGRSLYADDDHLSVYGARFVHGLFDPVLAPPGASGESVANGRGGDS